ncbi:hypothetical protein P7K49_038214 [Saguinus oedipus]|uniref:Uncharacterized protein n=1 Tax=Saguinus oedipus TaxID=9490 RepID=A0ABQ9TE09_SAGOE|nr:hypothetical protein P7K49_038214 [Saguinus oedipus]
MKIKEVNTTGIIMVEFLKLYNQIHEPKEKGSTRVHALNNVNKALRVLQNNNERNHKAKQSHKVCKMIDIRADTTLPVRDYSHMGVEVVSKYHKMVEWTDRQYLTFLYHV